MNISARAVPFAFTVLAAFCGSSVLAQSALGELLDAGGKQVSKEELVALISGATVSGINREGNHAKTEYKADGSFTAMVNVGGSNYAYFGTWAVEADGQTCGVIGGGKSKGQKFCGFFFKSGDQLFGSASDSDRGAAVLKRTLTK